MGTDELLEALRREGVERASARRAQARGEAETLREQARADGAVAAAAIRAEAARTAEAERARLLDGARQRARGIRLRVRQGELAAAFARAEALLCERLADAGFADGYWARRIEAARNALDGPPARARLAPEADPALSSRLNDLGIPAERDDDPELRLGVRLCGPRVEAADGFGARLASGRDSLVAEVHALLFGAAERPGNPGGP